MRTKLKKTYNLVIRFLIVIATYTFLYRQLFVKRDLDNFYHSFIDQFSNEYFTGGIILVFLMMIMNWAVEAVKWRYQIKKLEDVSFISSYEAVLTGISVSAFLPNRIGDYFGRVFILEKANHIEGIFITIVGSISQFIATVFLGSIALLFFLPLISDTSDLFFGYFYYAALVVILIVNFLTLLFYFNISILTDLLQKISYKRLKKLRDHVQAFSYFNRKELFNILLLSVLRYLVFSTQFYLLLRIFTVPVSVEYALILIPVIYLIITAIPTIALAELGVRGSMSIFIIGMYLLHKGLNPDLYEIGIFSASSSIWIINIVIPALVGTFFVFKLKFFRKED